jgi:hypothetical protein
MHIVVHTVTAYWLQQVWDMPTGIILHTLDVGDTSPVRGILCFKSHAYSLTGCGKLERYVDKSELTCPPAGTSLLQSCNCNF